MEQDTLIRSAAAALDGHVQSLFLAGSHGKGTQDAFSDIDFLAIAPPEAHAAIATLWRDTLESLAPIVFWNEQTGRGTLLNAITENWLRIDLFIAGPETLERRAQSLLKPLIDTAGHHARLPADLPPAAPNSRAVAYQIREFLRVLGLLPVALKRGEHVTIVKGIQILRDLLTDLMLEECTVADKGGILHLSRLLPQEDMETLRALPYPGPQPEALIVAHKAMAEAFLPRARRLAKALELDWPEAFEAATRAHLEREAGLTFA
ncbi:MAG: nucleotidyltransferase domain-containing protein [Pseudomonadota bacterium]